MVKVYLKEVKRYISVDRDGNLYWENGKQIATQEYRNHLRVKIRSLSGTKNAKKFHTYKVHRIVAHVFLGLRYTDNRDVHHVNGCGTNNCVENLEVIEKELHKVLHSKNQIIKTLEKSPRIKELQEKCRKVNLSTNSHCSYKNPLKQNRICGFPLG